MGIGIILLFQFHIINRQIFIDYLGGFGDDYLFQQNYEVSNVYNDSLTTGWLVQGQCSPECNINTEMHTNMNVIGGYNEDTNQIIIINRYSGNIWIFDPNTLEYTAIKPTNSLDININTTIQPLYVTINDTILIWGQDLDQGYGIRGFDMNTFSYFNSAFYGNDTYLKIYHNDRAKCMVTDGKCLLLIFVGDDITPYIIWLNLCDDSPSFNANSDIPISDPLGREEFSCQARNDQLFIIGGGLITTQPDKVFYTVKKAIKYINISVILDCVYSTDCPTFGDDYTLKIEYEKYEYALNVKRFSPQTVIFEESILIIGGYDAMGYKHSTEIMDFRLQETILSSNELKLAHDVSLVVLAKRYNNNVVFIFGGVNELTNGAIEQCAVGLCVYTSGLVVCILVM